MLSPGTTLGPYKITGSIGSGGMGEVYRARDTRLGRHVAIKVIHAEVARDPDRIKRFQQEARAAGALSHENVCAVYDLGEHEGSPYVVMELLEGESLRERLNAGALPVRKAIDCAAQVARGLAAAHAKGIVHRDLKPENLFLTKAGRVKVLDFGLAKLTRPDVVAPSGEPTISIAPTETGAILGTVGYMSPEQVRGERADARSDLFALGTVLYELLTGKRAFSGATYVETLNAILNEEPPPLSDSIREIPPGLELIVRRCLEKSPAERFQSASDLAFGLEGLTGSLSGVQHGVPVRAAPRWRRPALVGAAIALLALNDTGIFLWGQRSARATVPLPSRVTFRRGTVQLARFTPDGLAVLYNARWGDERWRLYTQRIGSSEARAVDTSGAWIKAVSATEMLTVSKDGRAVLGRRPLDGGTPREMTEGVAYADWNSDGSRLVVVRRVDGQDRIESPVGTVLLPPSGVSIYRDVRFSPRGDEIAFLESPFGVTDPYAADIAILAPDGKKRVISQGWRYVRGLEWSPDGRELWLAGTRRGSRHDLYAVSLSGRERLLMRLAASVNLHDVSRDGRVLITHETVNTVEMWGRLAGDSAQRDLSWLDATCKPVISPDGTKLLFQEEYEGGGDSAAIYLRRTDGSSPVRLADGRLTGVSPDWKWAVVYLGFPKRYYRLIPIGAGEVKVLSNGGVDIHNSGAFSPDGRRFFVSGTEPGKPERLYALDTEGGPPTATGPEGLEWSMILSSDGGSMLARPQESGRPWAFQPIEGGEPRPITGLRPQDEPLASSPDGRWLFVCEREPGFPVKLVRLELASGRREPWLRLLPPGRDGVRGLMNVAITPDGRYYAYDYLRRFTDLAVVSGLK